MQQHNTWTEIVLLQAASSWHGLNGPTCLDEGLATKGCGSGVFDSPASAAGMRQSSLLGWIHGFPRVECAGAQALNQHRSVNALAVGSEHRARNAREPGRVRC
jgi:hypothetical protein